MATKNGTIRQTITLSPGDPLPHGTYVNGWKLDSKRYGRQRLYMIIEVDTKPAKPA